EAEILQETVNGRCARQAQFGGSTDETVNPHSDPWTPKGLESGRGLPPAPAVQSFERGPASSSSFSSSLSGSLMLRRKPTTWLASIWAAPTMSPRALIP